MRPTKKYYYRAERFTIVSNLKGMKYVLYQFNTPKPEIVLISDTYSACNAKKWALINEYFELLRKFDPNINHHQLSDPYEIYLSLNKICDNPDVYFRIFKLEEINK